MVSLIYLVPLSYKKQKEKTANSQPLRFYGPINSGLISLEKSSRLLVAFLWPDLASLIVRTVYLHMAR